MNACDKCAYLLGRECSADKILKTGCKGCENWNNKQNCCKCETSKGSAAKCVECEHFKPWGVKK